MKFNEIASAEEQLALWRLISTNVWSILNSQVVNSKSQSKKSSDTKIRPPKARVARKKQALKKPHQPPKLPKPPVIKNNPPPQTSTLNTNHPASSYRPTPLPYLSANNSMSQKDLNDLQQQFQKTTNFA
jgi:hypothetical protein